MSNYTKSTNFATKDNLSPGDPLKIVRGTEIDTEFNNISTAISTKTDNSAAAITGGSISGITDLAIADGGTGASTATAAINNLLPAQTSAANKYLQSDGTNVSWDAVTLSTSDITGTLAVANGGTGVTSSTGTGNVVLSNSPTLVTPALGTPASGVATNLTGLPISTGVSGLGTGVATFLGTPSSANLASAVSDETGSGALVFANSPTLVTPALGTPSALVGTNITGTASGLTAGNVTTNANLTGAVTSVGNATSLGSFSSANLLGALTDETGTGSAVFATSPTLVTPILGTPTSATLTNATGLPIATGVSGLGTGIATALAVNTGSAGAPVLFNGALGTPSSGTVTNLTGTASININGTVGATTPTTGAFTTVDASGAVTLSGGTANGVTYLNGSKVLTSGSALTFDGTNFGVGIASATSLLDVRDGVGSIFTLGNTGNFAAGEFSRIKWKEGSTQLADIGWEADTNELRINNRVAYTTFYASNSEAMRITSSSLYTASGINVGFGTSSPAQKLAISSADTDRTAINLINTSSGGGNFNIGSIGSAGLWGASAGSLVIRDSNAGATRVVLDSSGNLGLGVTPSAWDTVLAPAFQIGPAGAFINGQGSTEGLYVGSNAYYNGGFKYVVNGYATHIRQQAGTHAWFTAPSGTAGNAISFTQAMTLDASGNLGIGTTSVNPTGLAILSGGQGKGVLVARNVSGSPTSGQSLGSYAFKGIMDGANSNVSSEAMIEAVAAENQSGSTAATSLVFYTKPSGTGPGSAPTERMRLDSAGIVTMSAYGAGAATFSAAGVISSVSDETWKIKDGVPSNPDVMLQKLEPGYWFYNDEKKETFGTERHLGFYAQNVNAAIGPEAAPEPEEGKPWGYYDRSVLAVTVMSLQKALATIESLKARLDAANL